MTTISHAAWRPGESYSSWLSRPFTKERDDARPPYSDITTRAEMPANDMEQYERHVGFPMTFLLTKEDIAMIKKVTGIDIDYDTGKITGGDEAPLAAQRFMRGLEDRRYDEWSRQEPTDEVSETSIRDVFKQSAMNGKPIDGSLMQKALNWLMDEVGDKANQAKTQQLLDVYA
jgi:hypothetical protein